MRISSTVRHSVYSICKIDFQLLLSKIFQFQNICYVLPFAGFASILSPEDFAQENTVVKTIELIYLFVFPENLLIFLHDAIAQCQL